MMDLIKKKLQEKELQSGKQSDKLFYQVGSYASQKNEKKFPCIL